MLVHLSVKNFAIVKQLDVSFEKGLTAITGETGAGKSIAIDALSLCLGERADANAVRHDAAKAEIIAHFSLDDIPMAAQWLDDHELSQEDDESACFVRRVVSKEGRSKAFVNGTPVSLQQLKTLGQYLLAIHGQNTHLQLLKEDYQRHVVDVSAHHPILLNKTRDCYQQWKSLTSELNHLKAEAQQRSDRHQLLSYQVAELDEFAILEGEFEDLEAEHKRLSHGQTLLEQAQTSFYHLYDNDEFNANSVVKQSSDRLAELQEHDEALAPIVAMLSEAAIQIEEAAHELRSYCEQLEIDPLRLQQVEQRYSQAMDLARKHGVQPEALYQFHQSLAEEFAALNEDENKLETLEDDVVSAMVDYQSASLALSQSRAKAANTLSKEIEAEVRKMNLPHANVQVSVEFNDNAQPSSKGQDAISILVSTNPGQQPDKLDKVVSGGELSRIGLAVQVITKSENDVPTMIFDEVDTGISGPTASVVGQLLRDLGDDNQVICVTHLPQVAARAHNQLFVTKQTDGKSTETQMLPLTKQARVDELARLLAGNEITDSAIANAKELLKSAESN